MSHSSNTSSLAELQKVATKALTRSLRASDADRTECLRATARAFVDAREHFFTKEGDPDWAGRTYAYRTWVREVMSDAHVPTDVLSSTQAAVRYHTGNVLREKLDDHELDRLGLRKESPRERSVEKRERTSEALSLVSGGQAIDSLDDILAAVTAITGILKRIDLGKLTPEESVIADEALAALHALGWERR